MESPKEKEAFSVIARAKSFAHAWRGIVVHVRSTHNAWIQIFLALVAFVLGIYYHISSTEWIMLVFAIGFVMSAEAFNTALEIDVNLTSPEYHPFARDIKDVSAGAVLISAVTALVVGLVIFLPKIFF